MCGIAGLMNLEGRVDLGRLHQMSRLLCHRGPDDEGVVLIDPRSGQWFTMGGADTPREVFASPHAYAPGHRGRPGASVGHATEGRGPETAPADLHYPLGLLHRRLSIVDLSPAGHQPMCDRDGALWIGTFDSGLCRLKAGKFSVIDREQDFPNSVIGDIEDDGSGFFCLPLYQLGKILL